MTLRRRIGMLERRAAVSVPPPQPMRPPMTEAELAEVLGHLSEALRMEPAEVVEMLAAQNRGIDG